MTYLSLKYCYCPTHKTSKSMQFEAHINPNNIVSITKKNVKIISNKFNNDYYKIVLSNNKKLYVNSQLVKRTGIFTVLIDDNPEYVKFENYLKSI